MTEKELYFPTRILLSEGDVRAAEQLLIPIALQTPTGPYPARPWAELRGKCALLFDFGQELRGGVRIVCHWLVGAKTDAVPARLRFGESAAECCSEVGERGASNYHSPRDLPVLLSGMSSVRFGESGFRFARLDVELPEGASLNLLAVAAEGEILSLPVQYDYTGKDPLLADIYRTAKRTVDLCAAGDYVWDGIKRDRLVWIGDMHPEMLALTTLYGRVPSLESSILFMKDTTPPEAWMCNIVTYSAWWLTTLADYTEITGATDFAAPPASLCTGNGAAPSHDRNRVGGDRNGRQSVCGLADQGQRGRGRRCPRHFASCRQKGRRPVRFLGLPDTGFRSPDRAAGKKADHRPLLLAGGWAEVYGHGRAGRLGYRHYAR